MARILNSVVRELCSDRRGSTAVEFSLVLPIVILLIFGTIGLTGAMAVTASLHYATEDAARCASVKTTICSNTGTTSTYATGKYQGPNLSGLSFVLTSQTCGSRVIGSGTYVLRTGLASFNIPVSATACYPLG